MDINELKKQIDNARQAYYNNGESGMSDKEFDEKVALYESLTGDTIPVGAEIVGNMPKEKHEFPALSLDKTKNVEELIATFPNESVLMWKLDGLTLQLTYENGKLVKAATRGNGEIGQNIMDRIHLVHGVPLTIPTTDKVVVRGEALMSYKDFEAVNAKMLALNEEPFKNARNLAAGTILAQNKDLLAARPVSFRTFSLVYADEQKETFLKRLRYLTAMGFCTVDYSCCFSQDQLRSAIQMFTDSVEENIWPVDGLVVVDNDAALTDSLPATNKHPNVRGGFALKWQDETVETTLRRIEWSASRTGLLNPVAVFDAVELEGTTVTRASLHNVSYIEKLNLEPGDKITVYKANKIIPQVDANLSIHEQVTYLGTGCPCCGCTAEVSSRKSINGIVKEMWCKNPNCSAKKVGSFVHFAERDCMEIKGLSEQTIEKLVNAGYLKTFAGFYKLSDYASEMVKWDGFGEKAVNNMLEAVEASKKADFIGFVHALGIPNIGKGQARLLAKKYSINSLFFLSHSVEEFEEIDGFGPVLAQSLMTWLNENADTAEFRELVDFLQFEDTPAKDTSGALTGKTFVVTGAVEQFPNRDAIHAFIESNGGKTSGSVSAKTDYLVNNDITSESGKNKKAKELGVPIITEADLIAMVG